MSVFSEVLQPLKARLPRLVREFEILRISAKIEGSDTAASAFAARQEVLRWVQKKAGKKLPQEAWDLHDYEMLHGGRNSAATRPALRAARQPDRAADRCTLARLARPAVADSPAPKEPPCPTRLPPWPPPR